MSMKETKGTKEIKLFTIQGEYILGQNLQWVNYLEKATVKEFTKGELKDTSYWLTRMEITLDQIPSITKALLEELDKEVLGYDKDDHVGDDEYYDFIPDAFDQVVQFGHQTGQLGNKEFQDELIRLRDAKYTHPEDGLDAGEAYDIETYFDGPAMYGLTLEEI